MKRPGQRDLSRTARGLPWFDFVRCLATSKSPRLISARSQPTCSLSPPNPPLHHRSQPPVYPRRSPPGHSPRHRPQSTWAQALRQHLHVLAHGSRLPRRARACQPPAMDLPALLGEERHGTVFAGPGFRIDAGANATIPAQGPVRNPQQPRGQSRPPQPQHHLPGPAVDWSLAPVVEER